jgi:hypothetical protein
MPQYNDLNIPQCDTVYQTPVLWECQGISWNTWGFSVVLIRLLLRIHVSETESRDVHEECVIHNFSLIVDEALQLCGVL